MGGSKRQALLAMLALRQGRVVGVDALVDGLWGEELPAAPRNALHHHIARLRAALGEESIVGSPDGYALKDARVDAVQFEELLAETRAALRDGDVPAAADAVASALALWRGPALQGLTATAWFGAEARRLEALRVDALEEQFEVRLALGEHRELMPALRSALADNPFRERLWGQLMLALYRSGRQADALETFQEARRVLADELGLEPGPELRRIQDAILAHDPAIAAVPVDRRRRGNLPALATSFVGREDELGEVTALLQEHRLVTLTGPPGVGKSRLAVETARSLEREFPDGIWFVEFARAGDAPDAVRLLAHAVDVRGSDPLARVTSRLRDAGALVVLDACEHVLEEAARIASTLLAECPRCGSWRRAARRFASPAKCESPSHRSARRRSSSSSSVRGRRGRASSRTPRPSRLAAEIARRVDGLPLAIELAAARVNVLGLAELVSILERRAALLRDSPAADPSRTALQELVAWSYDLLHGDEKTLLQQLAVHRGGASLPSLAAIAATHGLNEATVAYLVSALVDKSIVSAIVRGRRRPVRHARHRPRVRARASRRERRARRRPRRPRRVLRGAGRGGARRAARAGMAALGTPPGAGARQSLGCARVRAGSARPCGRESARDARVVLRAGRARLRGTALHSSWRCLPRATTPRSSCGSSCSPSSATSRPRSSISRPRSRRANARSRSPRARRRPGSWGSRD